MGRLLVSVRGPQEALAAAEGAAHIADVEYPASALGSSYALNIKGNRAKEAEWRDKLIHRRDTRLAEIDEERHLSDKPPEIKAAALAATLLRTSLEQRRSQLVHEQGFLFDDLEEVA